MPTCRDCNTFMVLDEFQKEWRCPHCNRRQTIVRKVPSQAELLERVKKLEAENAVLCNDVKYYKQMWLQNAKE